MVFMHEKQYSQRSLMEVVLATVTAVDYGGTASTRSQSFFFQVEF